MSDENVKKFFVEIEVDGSKLLEEIKGQNFKGSDIDYVKALIEGAFDKPVCYNAQVSTTDPTMTALFNVERALSHSIQTSIQDPNITVPSVFVKEVMDIRDAIRQQIREMGYKGQF